VSMDYNLIIIAAVVAVCLLAVIYGPDVPGRGQCDRPECSCKDRKEN
jgi:hypothetical protein